MAMMLWVLLGLSLLVQDSLCSPKQTQGGCQMWKSKGDDVCCEICAPGNRVVNRCGKSSQELCKPCESGTYTTHELVFSCTQCSKCTGVQIVVENCTTTTDTKCGCSKGYTCGDEKCSFCVDTCPIGQEPTEDRSCRPCPEGTFNDKVHQYCKPWSKCQEPNQKIVSKGNAISDIKCADITVAPVKATKQPEKNTPKGKDNGPENPGQLFWAIIASFIVFISTIISAIVIATVKLLQKRKKTKKIIITPAVIQTPTDDPRTLIATECSFHEAQQEQGSSTESLNSKDSSQQLIV